MINESDEQMTESIKLPKNLPSISLLGLGLMGAPMAHNILQKLGALTVWNRSAGPVEALVRAGARAVSTPREAATAITLTVLPDLEQVRPLLLGEDGLLAGWSEAGIESPILVIHGTVSPIAVAEFASELESKHGVRVVDAPMSGGTVGAAAGTLSIMMGGSDEAIREITPAMNAVGATIRHMGSVGSGQMTKACNQIVVAGTVAAISEAMLLAEGTGLDRATVLEVLRGGLANSEVLRQKGGNWATESFVAGGTAKNQLKDLRFVREAESHFGVNLPVTNQVADQFEAMIEAGLGNLDHTGLYAYIAEQQNHKK